MDAKEKADLTASIVEGLTPGMTSSAPPMSEERAAQFRRAEGPKVTTVKGWKPPRKPMGVSGLPDGADDDPANW